MLRMRGIKIMSINEEVFNERYRGKTGCGQKIASSQ
jgi:hypothetical protein